MFKMELLNSEELKNIKGGTDSATGLSWKCSTKGDTVICGPKDKIILCATKEVSCPSTFSSKCSVFGDITISGCPSVSIS
jgi:hypothetical protein